MRRSALVAAALLGAACSVAYRPTIVPPSLSAAPEVRVAVLLSDGRLLDYLAPSRDTQGTLQLSGEMPEPQPLRGLARDHARGLVYALDPASQATVHVVDVRGWTQKATVTLGAPGDRFTDLEVGPKSDRLYALGASAKGDVVLAIADPGGANPVRTVVRPAAGGSGWHPVDAGLDPAETEMVVAYQGQPGAYDRIKLGAAPATECDGPAACGSADGGVAAGRSVTAVANGDQLLLDVSGKQRSVANGFAAATAPLAVAIPPRADRVYVLARCDTTGLSSIDVKSGKMTFLERSGDGIPCGAVLRPASDETLVASAPGIWTIGVADKAYEQAPDLGALVVDALPI